MAKNANPDFIRGMNLTKEEIETLERHLDILERANKNSAEFLSSGQARFTPVALLVVAVAKFVYDVYQDYGAMARDPREFQDQFKRIVKELRRIEDAGDDLPGLDVYARLRADL